MGGTFVLLSIQGVVLSLERGVAVVWKVMDFFEGGVGIFGRFWAALL